MKTLVAWDDPKEAEVLELYLSAGDNRAALVQTAEDLLERARREKWDVLLMSLTFPTPADDAFAVFERVQQEFRLPVVVACRPAELFQLPRFLNRGLRFHLPRDNQADFMFLVLSSLESAVAAAKAAESERLYQRLRSYLGETPGNS